MSVDPVLAQVARLGLALLFAIAAFHKLRDAAAFRTTLGEYRIAPASLTPALALGVVGAELATTGLLLLPGASSGGAAGALALLAAYSAAIGINLWRGRRHLDCGCLGPASRQPIAPWLLARNAAVALAALVLLAPGAARPLLWVDSLSIVAALLSLSLLWNAAHQLGALPEGTR